MADRVLLVDLENVQGVDLSAVPVDVRVFIFYGMTQKKIPEELVVRAQPLGQRLKWLKISGQGPNALDFHIAFYLGQELSKCPGSQCLILSRDTGFDPLVRHLQELGHSCRRVTSLTGTLFLEQCVDADYFSRLTALLKKERARPTKRKGLAGKLKSWFPQLTENQRRVLLQRLFDEARVREPEALLTYHL